MTEADRPRELIDREELRGAIRAVIPPQSEPYDVAQSLRLSLMEARQRMHLHTLSNLSARAIHSRYPSLIRVAHFEQMSVHDELSHETEDMAAFSLWTTAGHVMMADGRIARRAIETDWLPADYDGLTAVHDSEIHAYHNQLAVDLLRKVNTLAQTTIIRDNSGQWLVKPVTRARLRQNYP